MLLSGSDTKQKRKCQQNPCTLYHLVPPGRKTRADAQPFCKNALQQRLFTRSQAHDIQSVLLYSSLVKPSQGSAYRIQVPKVCAPMSKPMWSSRFPGQALRRHRGRPEELEDPFQALRLLGLLRGELHVLGPEHVEACPGQTT